MRALSLPQANRCETAKTPHCRCRCGGAFHGINRGKTDEANPVFFAELPAEDPHHIDSPEQKKAKKRRAREEQRSLFEQGA